MTINTLPTLLSVDIPHLGKNTASYRCVPATPDPSRRTLVMVHSFMTNSNLFLPQLESPALKLVFNLVAIDQLGHGGTTCESETFTNWDS